MTTATPPPGDPPLTRLGAALEHVDQLTATVEQLAQANQELQHTVNTENATRRRFWMNLVTLFVLAGFILFGIGRINSIVRRLDSCLVAGGDCYTDFARNGVLGSNRLMDFNGCVLLIEPNLRVPQDIQRCKTEANENFLRALEEARMKKNLP